jgi:hypothetical protein
MSFGGFFAPLWSVRLLPQRPPPEVQAAFHFLLATAMHEAGKFELSINTAISNHVEGRFRPLDKEGHLWKL